MEEEQETPRLTKNSKCLGYIFAVICVITGVALFVAGIILVQHKDQHSPIIAWVSMFLALLLFYFPVMMLFCMRNYSSTQTTDDVVVSSIPAEDLEKSPAPTLLYNHVPFVESSSIDLPDYFTAVQNTGDVYSSVDADVCTEGVPEIRPPCYEQALEMAAMSATSEAVCT